MLNIGALMYAQATFQPAFGARAHHKAACSYLKRSDPGPRRARAEQENLLSFAWAAGFYRTWYCRDGGKFV